MGRSAPFSAGLRTAFFSSPRTTILVADHTKFDRTAPVKIAHISIIQHLVTDENPPEAIRTLCIQGGIALHLTPEKITGREPQ
jgi:DeoR family glycerol-3-phosphate regulon repressor